MGAAVLAGGFRGPYRLWAEGRGAVLRMTYGSERMPTAHCLDITRLISRLGKGVWTGVDRVERAYLRALLRDPVPLFLLTRTAVGFLLIAPERAPEVLDRLEGGTDWGPVDLVGRLTRRAHPLKRRAESDLRRMSVGRCRRGALHRMLAATLPVGTDYYNTGHSNLSEEGLRAWRAVPQARVSVLIHDTIPLDHPAFQRPGTVESFRARLTRVSAHADRVIYAAEATRADAERWLTALGRVPAAIVAPLGVEVPEPDDSRLPTGLSDPYFVTVGTIEPRKNHALLLDVWETLPDTAPKLVIAGTRGWNNEAVFARLDSAPMMGRTVFEFANLDDRTLAALVRNSRGLLFPSFAEGFGLPPIEAAALQVPIICSNLPVYQEILGDLPVYLDSADVYIWRKTIKTMTEQARQNTRPRMVQIPSWRDHFNRVLTRW